MFADATHRLIWLVVFELPCLIALRRSGSLSISSNTTNTHRYTKVDTLHPLTDVQAAYIAGIIDGEGYIGLCANSKSFTLRVAVKTTSETLTNWLTDTTGSQTKVQFRKETRTDYRRRHCYEWRVFGDQARRILKAIRPYLQLKKEQADLAIEYQDLPSEEKVARGNWYREQIIARNLLAKGREDRVAQECPRAESPPTADTESVS